MKTITSLLLLALAGAVLARPSLIAEENTHQGSGSRPQTLPSSSEDSSESTEDVHSSPEPLVPALSSLLKQTPEASSTDSAVVRSRRSPRGNNRDNNNNDRNRGSANVDIRREEGRGTVGRADVRGTVYENDRVKVDAHGDWSKTLDGPQRSKPSYGGGFRVEW